MRWYLWCSARVDPVDSRPLCTDCRRAIDRGRETLMAALQEKHYAGDADRSRTEKETSLSRQRRNDIAAPWEPSLPPTNPERHSASNEV